MSTTAPRSLLTTWIKLKDNVKRTNPSLNGYMMYDLCYMIFWKRLNRRANRSSSFQGPGLRGGADTKGGVGTFQDDKPAGVADP